MQAILPVHITLHILTIAHEDLQDRREEYALRRRTSRLGNKETAWDGRTNNVDGEDISLVYSKEFGRYPPPSIGYALSMIATTSSLNASAVETDRRLEILLIKQRILSMMIGLFPLQRNREMWKASFESLEQRKKSKDQNIDLPRMNDGKRKSEEEDEIVRLVRGMQGVVTGLEAVIDGL